jgi:hypothetical protein
MTQVRKSRKGRIAGGSNLEFEAVIPVMEHAKMASALARRALFIRRWDGAHT